MGIVFTAIAAAAFYVVAFGVWAIGRIACEDAEEPDWSTVRCDDERGSGVDHLRDGALGPRAGRC